MVEIAKIRIPRAYVIISLICMNILPIDRAGLKNGYILREKGNGVASKQGKNNQYSYHYVVGFSMVRYVSKCNLALKSFCQRFLNKFAQNMPNQNMAFLYAGRVVVGNIEQDITSGLQVSA